MRTLGCIFAAILLAQTCLAQQQQQFSPHIGYIYPAGGRAGSSFPVTVGGQRLKGVDGAVVSGDGVEATIVEHVLPLTPVQATILRDQLKELVDRKIAAATRPATRPFTADDEKQLAEIRTKLAGFQPRIANPAIAEQVKLKVKIAPNAQSGRRELRLLTAMGLTNPMVFEIGSLQEFSRPPASPIPKQPAVMNVKLPAVINGQIMPGQADRYRFAARKGDQIVIVAEARQLVSYLADAVPGWFQATIALLDTAGREVAFADDYRFQPDPILRHLIAADGDYIIEIRDSIYRGREDFVYRIRIGELPLITSVFPLGGPANTRVAVSLKGWNLPTSNVVLDATDLDEGVVPLRASKLSGLCNAPPLALDTLPECIEHDANNSPGSAQAVTLPIIINGRIDRACVCDFFSFEAAAGERIVAEVMARRLDSPLDSAIRLTDSAGRQVAFNDDHEDKSNGLSTHHADSYLAATLPASGRYFVQLWDIQQKGGVEYAYRLRLSAPRPDFALRLVPSSINVRPGASVPVTVFALRRDGFDDEITVSLKNAPAGFKLTGGPIGAKTDQVKMTLKAPSKWSQRVVPLQLEGSGQIDGRRIAHAAVGAEDMMQAFIYRHLVASQQSLVSATTRPVPSPARK